MSVVGGIVALGVLLGAVGAQAQVSPQQFDDVPPSHPFHREIGWLADVGVTTGFDDGTFRPTIAVTRQAMAAQLQRLWVELGQSVPEEIPDPGFQRRTALPPVPR